MADRTKSYVFNAEYMIMAKIGQGRTSKVYLGEHIDGSGKRVAIKMYTVDFMQRNDHSERSVAKSIPFC